MPDPMTGSEFHRRADLPDWRMLLNRIEAMFVAGSFEDGAEFVRQVAAAGEAANHHPNIDLRYPGRVHVVSTSHDAHGLTERDIDLAGKISELARAAGLETEPLKSMTVEVGIDALDIDAVRPFWKALLGYRDEPPSIEGGQVVAIVDPMGIGPAFWFQQMDIPRPQRNRMHIDVTVPYDVADERLAASIQAGGTLLTAEYARAFWVLADPEGNEACVCTWQERG